MKNILIFTTILLFTSCFQKTGCGKLNYIDGLTYFNNNKFTGNCESFYMGGKLRSIQEYSEGLDHGKWEFYFENGKVQTSGNFNLGKRIGEWKYYHNNGKLWKLNKYDSNGARYGVWYEFDETGFKIDSIIN